MKSDVDAAAQKIWDYMLMHQPLKKCDAIFVLGSRDDRTAVYAAELFARGYGKWLIISGGGARLKWNDASSEAEHFAHIVLEEGVPRDRLILEDKATNTGGNITFTYHLLQQLGHRFGSLLLVQKPYMERRTYATFKKQWPDRATEFIVSSPPIELQHYFGHEEANSKDSVINVMVGDLQRIKEYPKRGFQIEQPIPDDVWEAWKFLVEQGYDERVMSASD
jgi:uncharacterized SAM-binding protein YcdF (DUF218 family)